MTPYIGKRNYEYLSPDSLFTVDKQWRFSPRKITLSNWVPKQCKSLVKYCSGYYSQPDIVWKGLDRVRQILLLASSLIAPGSITEECNSSWQLLIDNISKSIKTFTDNDPNISPGTVKEMVNYLCFLFKFVNYEINFIQAKLTNVAERTITTLVFAFAFESLWKIKLQKRSEQKAKTEVKKDNFRQYFLQKIENRKIIRENWNREKMKESDCKISAKFAQDFLESVKRGVLTAEQLEIENYFNNKKEIFSHAGLLLTANCMLMTELEKDPESEVSDQDNFVIKYICNRNDELKKIFADKWAKVQDEYYLCILREIRKKLSENIESFKQVLIALLDSLKQSSNSSRNSEYQAFDSDSNFEIADIEACKEIDFEKKRETPFKAMLMYLHKYLNPQVTPGQFQDVFKQNNIFEVDG
ncbi:hypothetical protein LOD99_1411 [Oopsacas minuta]|uniref:Uncharacterized protein n=1 Tax=Oopsacas minuta TaxID=111878 RepID=A0AAV7K5W2_9METZ|nr:hypothetical protein LOD99_1411 [Oopsacas minuta]